MLSQVRFGKLKWKWFASFFTHPNKAAAVVVLHPIYQQLNASRREIRLLTIRAAPEDDAASHPPVECDLVTVPLEEAPPYRALSYVWGDPTITSAITLNGATLQVTE